MRSTHALEVHRLHRFVHAPHDARYVPRHLSHRHGRLDQARGGADAARETEEVQQLALLVDRVGCVYPSPVVVALLERLNNTSPVCRVSSFSKGMWGRGKVEVERRGRGDGGGGGIHVPSLVVIFLNSHTLGSFFAYRLTAGRVIVSQRPIILN